MSRTVVNPASSVRPRVAHADDRFLRALERMTSCGVPLPVVVVADQVRVHVHQAGKQRVPGEVDAAGVVGGIGDGDDIDDALALDDHGPIR